jgi:hypothetical protein
VFDELSIRAILGDSFERLAAANYVVRTANAECVSCPACGDGHAEEVVPLSGANGQLRYYISCPTYFRVEIDPELLEQWTINWNALASGMAAALALAGQCTLLISDRLWRLGRLKWRGTYRDALLARGLSWHDGRDIARQIARNTRPVVFVGDRPVPQDVWVGREPPLVQLSQVASFAGEQTVIDVDAVLAAILLAEAEPAPVDPLPLNPAGLKQVIRRQIRAEGKTNLTDDILLAAYHREGSVRKAAAFLTESTGRTVTKDRVQSAVRRSGSMVAD